MVLSERINEHSEVNSSYRWECTLCQKQTHSIEQKREERREEGNGQGRAGMGKEGKRRKKMSLSDSFSIKLCSFSSAQFCSLH